MLEKVWVSGLMVSSDPMERQLWVSPPEQH